MISNAACEPHVQDLCRFLVSLGAKIDGIGSNVLHVAGVERLFGGAHSIGPEHIEVGSFIGMAAVTGGDITIEGSRPTTSGRAAGASRGSASRSSSATTGCACRPDQELAIRDDLGGAIPKIEDGPWPAFPADLTSIAVVVATQARGNDPRLREDVREPAVLRRQARLDGRAHHPLRPASRRDHRAVAALRPAHVEPRHPRRHGDGDRRALRRGHARRSATPTRSTRATSASTSACARSARTSNASS